MQVVCQHQDALDRYISRKTVNFVNILHFICLGAKYYQLMVVIYGLSTKLNLNFCASYYETTTTQCIGTQDPF